MSVLGQSLPRTDGRLKVTGGALYSADHAPAGLAHAVCVTSPVARGQLLSVQTARAEALPGVLAVLTHQTVPGLRPVGPDLQGGGMLGESRPPLSGPQIDYAGQVLAVVVAETLEQAQHAALLVEFEVAEEPPTLSMDGPGERPDQFMGEARLARGDLGQAQASREVNARYTTPVEHHHPIEPCATVAEWDGDTLILHDATRWTVGAAGAVADMLGLPRDRVRVQAPFVGGAFGAKAFLWMHAALAAVAARAVGRPVKLVLTRAQMASSNGHRPATRQDLRLGAADDGALQLAEHLTLSETSPICDFTEPCGRVTPVLYAGPHVQVDHHRVRRNVASPNPMRAPGEAAGMFALESAMDELAVALQLDPLTLRLRNDTLDDLQEGRPFSSRHLQECLLQGAERFGWKDRVPKGGQGQDGPWRVGWGLASSIYPANQARTEARATCHRDGRLTVACATHELGTGTATVMRQVAADAFGLPLDAVEFQWGDSDLPFAPVAGGSQTTVSVGSAIRAAATAMGGRLARMACADPGSALSGRAPEDLHLRGLELIDRDDPGRRESVPALLERAGLSELEVTAEAAPGDERQHASFYSFGAVYAEVRVDAELGRIRVSRVVGVYDVGRVLNPLTARSQLRGGIIAGLGMALLEETRYDPESARPLNPLLDEYLVPTCADTPEIEVGWLDLPDPLIGGAGLGARGLGEIGIVGTAAAVANAVYDATGLRLRDLPLRCETLLG